MPQKLQLLLMFGKIGGYMQSIPQCCRAMLYKSKLDKFFLACTDLCTAPKKHANTISDALSHSHPHVLRCIKQVYLNKYKVTPIATVSNSAVVRQIQQISERIQIYQLIYTLLGITARLRVI